MELSSLLLIDVALRAAAAVLLALVAILLLRDYRRTSQGLLGSLFAVGAMAHTLCSAPAFATRTGPVFLVLVALASGNSLIFWLFARALFDDQARVRAWHVLLWSLIAVAGVACRFFLPASHPLRPLLAMQAVLFALMAGAQSLSSWSSDLIEPRRRLRLLIVVAAAGYTVVTSLAGLAQMSPATRGLGSVVEAAVLGSLALVVAASLLRVSGEDLLVSPARAEDGHEVPRVDAPVLDESERTQVTALERLMQADKVYRREGLSVGKLAAIHKIPEYKLRRLINRGLGFRNFTAFLNHYRLAEVRSRLADPAHAATPILTIALDAGFSSLGPFNRAFKADSGLTPGQYRREQQELATSATKSTP
jgi:AraC-like DNA-binding protein